MLWLQHRKGKKAGEIFKDTAEILPLKGKIYTRWAAQGFKQGKSCCSDPCPGSPVTGRKFASLLRASRRDPEPSYPVGGHGAKPTEDAG